MDEVIYYCPQCSGRLLYVDEVPLTGDANNPPSAPTLYCPKCEMLVLAVARPASAPPPPNPHTFGEPGTWSPEMGSNSDGGQGGGSADNGASHWNVDPTEDERNTWQDKAKKHGA